MKIRPIKITLPGQLPEIRPSRKDFAQAEQECQALLRMQDELRMSQPFPSALGSTLMQRVIDGIHSLPPREEDGALTIQEAYPPHQEAETPVAIPGEQTILGVNPPDFTTVS